MKRIIKALQHLKGAISHSIGVALFCFSLLIIVWLIILIIPNDNNQFLAFGVGVVASIVASLIQKIYDKYWESYSTYEAIIRNVYDWIVEYEGDIEKLKQDKNKLWGDYIKICAMSSHLSYTKDFNRLSQKLNRLIESVFNDDADIKEKLKSLTLFVKKLAIEIDIKKLPGLNSRRTRKRTRK